MASFEIRFSMSPTMLSLSGTLREKYAQSKLLQPFKLGPAECRMLPDNQLSLDLEAQGPEDAIHAAKDLANRLCMLLTLGQTAYFKAQFNGIFDSESGNRIKLSPELSSRVQVLSVTLLAEDLDFAAPNVGFTDVTLEKALAYFYHAMYLAQELDLRLPVRYHELLIFSDVVLNLHKAISTIIGDPSVDRDYQSRYKKFGIEKKLWEDAEKVRGLRDDYDAAHYSPGWERVEKLKQDWGVARDTGRRIITRYIRWLAPQTSPGTSSSSRTT